MRIPPTRCYAARRGGPISVTIVIVSTPSSDGSPTGGAAPIVPPHCFEAIRDSVLLVDLASGLVIDANASSEALFGLTRASLIGATHGSLFPPGASPALGDGAAGLPASVDVEVVTASGAHVRVAASVVPLALADGRDALQLILRSPEAHSRSERVLAEHRRVARELSAAATAAEIATTTVAAALRIPGIDIAGVYLFEGADLALVASGGVDASFVDAHARYAPDAPNVRWLRSTAAAHGDPMVLPANAVAALERWGIRSVMAMPFRFRGEVFGCLNVASREHAELPLPAQHAAGALAAMAGEALARAAAEQAMLVSDDLLRELFETMSQGVIYFDRDGRVQRSNPAARCILGLSEAELGERRRDDPRWQTVRPDGTPCPAEAFPVNAAARTGRPVVGEVLGVTLASGAVRWLQIDAYPHAVSPDGMRVHVVFSDITDARAAQRSLLAHEERYQSLLQAAMDGFAVLNEGRVLEVNAALAAMLGQPATTLIGQPVRAWIDPARSPDAEVVAALQHGGRRRFETALRTASGATIEVEVSAWAGAGHVLAFVHDITERRRAEAELRRQEVLLRQAQKMEAVGRLAGGIAHDFNNLLTVIGSTVELILDDLHADDPLRADLDQIKSAGTRAAALTRQLLTFSRRHVDQPRRVDVNALLTELGRMLRRLIGEDIALAIELACPTPDAWVDPGQLEQVVVNLVVNARDAMPRGGHLRITTALAELDAAQGEVPAGRYVRITVGDTGVGMTPQVLERIFEPFFTTKGEYGTGLGLATVYGIVRKADGHVLVESQPGGGSQFQVYLPVHVAAAVEPEAAPAPAALEGRGETLLVVEDARDVRQIVRKVLTSAGYRVVTATGGEEALAICAGWQGPLHLVVSDVIMPEMSGRQFVERLRESRPAIRVLYVSGYTDEVLSREGVLEAGVRLLRKPFALAELQRQVREVLDEA